MTTPTDPAVKAAYDDMPAPQRALALSLRDLVLSVAAETPAAGPITETLKWGQPTFATAATKAGSPLRIGVTKAGDVGLFAHCATTIISDYAATFPGADRIDGKRSVLFARQEDVMPDRLRLLIRHGLTYHVQDKVPG